ncbi:MepB family protein [Candidatus Enterococcus ikei]|uniref:MepB family protein n=1 Tax=Candidatus Enterococcus ikei TaxID=2815326 RepID=A0ABS3GVG1_9ENTE|nr:MepB family protein [Enterococcus sp. DIV0869a]MBO0439242.1 MepB family protein [Enterococcus sp. DIV0869a]
MESIKFISELLPEFSNESLKNMKLESQNSDYEGATFSLSNQSFRSRKAKITPKKLGYFVVFWEKDEANKNKPYDLVSAPDKLIITIFDQEKVGQFIFPKAILAKNNILISETSLGKMALRVYPDWVTGLNKNASTTQKWQRPYFINLTENRDSRLLKKLYFN